MLRDALAGAHPPFGPPAHPVPPQEDFHFPASEPSERAGLAVPLLLSTHDHMDGVWVCVFGWNV